MRRAYALSGGMLLVALGGWVVAQENLPVAGQRSPQKTANPQERATITRHYSYSIGLEIGSSFQDDGVQLDVESLVAGLRDGLNDAEPKYDQQTCNLAMEQLGRTRMQAHIRQNKEYLEKNRQAEGVNVLPSGLQYKVLKEGSGRSPSLTDTVQAHYSGRLIDDTVFDSSYERNQPFTTRVDGVIQGWTEALQNMQVGEKWLIVVPSELAYGADGAGGVIPPHSTLIFEMELLGIQ